MENRTQLVFVNSSKASSLTDSQLKDILKLSKKLGNAGSTVEELRSNLIKSDVVLCYFLPDGATAEAIRDLPQGLVESAKLLGYGTSQSFAGLVESLLFDYEAIDGLEFEHDRGADRMLFNMLIENCEGGMIMLPANPGDTRIEALAEHFEMEKISSSTSGAAIYGLNVLDMFRDEEEDTEPIEIEDDDEGAPEGTKAPDLAEVIAAEMELHFGLKLPRVLVERLFYEEDLMEPSHGLTAEDLRRYVNRIAQQLIGCDYPDENRDFTGAELEFFVKSINREAARLVGPFDVPLIETVNPDDRWDKGVEHDDRSYDLLKWMQRYDDKFWTGEMDRTFSCGGDGDPGDNLMYILDEYYAALDTLRLSKD